MDEGMKPNLNLRDIAQAGVEMSELAANIEVAGGLAKRAGVTSLALACYTLSQALEQYQKEMVKFAMKTMEDD